MNKHQKKVHKATKQILLIARLFGFPQDYKLARQCVREEYRKENIRGRSR